MRFDLSDLEQASTLSSSTENEQTEETSLLHCSKRLTKTNAIV